MSVSGISSRSAFTVRSLVEMRAQLDDLQRQLGTGRKSTDYAGLGVDRGLDVGLRARKTAIAGYGDTITMVNMRLSMAQTALSRIGAIQRETKNAAQQTVFNPDSAGQTAAQRTAALGLGELLGLLNTRAGDRYLFSGRAVDTPAAETLDHILDGDGARAGLKQMIAERNQADLGSNGLGRLVIAGPVPPTTVGVNEDAAGSPFGFKLRAITTTIAGATVSGPSGSPAAVSIDLGANPAAGQSVRISFNLPDGSTEDLTLTATTNAPPSDKEFAIGATAQDTATNLRALAASEIGKLARTSLSAASAIAASRNFFDVDAGQPPQRVAGPPFDTATALVAGTSANTVTWYTGEMGSDSARGTAVARVDDTISVSYGMRANEEGLRWAVEHIATFAATTFQTSDPDAKARFIALNQRIGSALGDSANMQSATNISAELTGAQSSLQAAKDRHAQTTSTIEGMLDSIEGVSQEEVAASILALQTRLQASLQTTATLYHTSILNYL